MKSPSVTAASVAVVIALSAALDTACTTNASTSTASSVSTTSSGSTSCSAGAGPSDYTALLIKESDINIMPDVYILKAGQTIQNPNGEPGVSSTFANDDREIIDTIEILPDAAGAATALERARGALSSLVTGSPGPAAIGTGGTMVSGTTPDGPIAETVLLFTEDKALIMLQFGSAPNDPVPPEFVSYVGGKQDGAIKNCLHR